MTIDLLPPTTQEQYEIKAQNVSVHFVSVTSCSVKIFLTFKIRTMHREVIFQRHSDEKREKESEKLTTRLPTQSLFSDIAEFKSIKKKRKKKEENFEWNGFIS